MKVLFEPTPTHFCSELNLEDCTPCPENGNCIQGELICENGYLRQGDTCVENPWVINAAKSDLKDLENFLMLKRGAYECGEEDGYKIQYEIIENELRAKYGFDNLDMP